MKENPKSQFWNKILPISIIILFLILVFYLFFMPAHNLDADTSQKVEKIPGIYGVANVGNLSFILSNVDLHMWARSGGEVYTLYWYFIVTNNGADIENVSNCGFLLFSDGSQYNFDVDIATSKEAGGKCKYTEIVPGARVPIYSSFYFSNSSRLPYEWIMDGVKVWNDQAPNNSKITYFSKQGEGIVKFEIDKGQIFHSYAS